MCQGVQSLYVSVVIATMYLFTGHYSSTENGLTLVYINLPSENGLFLNVNKIE